MRCHLSEKMFTLSGLKSSRNVDRKLFFFFFKNFFSYPDLYHHPLSVMLDIFFFFTSIDTLSNTVHGRCPVRQSVATGSLWVWCQISNSMRYRTKNSSLSLFYSRPDEVKAAGAFRCNKARLTILNSTE